MLLKKPTKEQYEALFGPLEGQIRVVLALAFEDDGKLMFASEESASYRKFRDVVEALKNMVENDVKAGVFVTKGLDCLDLYVRDVGKLFAIEDGGERFDQLKAMVRSKLRLDGRILTDAEYDALPFSDQIVAVNNAANDVTGESKNPLTQSAKE